VRQYASAMSRPAERRFLVSGRLDGLLVGWLAVIVWVAVFAAPHLGIDATFPALTLVYWAGAVVTAAHFGLSYHLAYRDGLRAMRARPFALAIGPAVLAAVLAAVVLVTLGAGKASTQYVTSVLISSVYLMTTWHYVKQVYGVGRVGAAYADIKLDQWDVRILRYALYPLAVVGAAQILERGRPFYLAGYRFGLGVLPYGGVSALRVIAFCAVVPIVVVFVRIALRAKRLPPAVLVAPYVAAFLWLGLPTNPVLTLLLLAPFHGLQYLAIGHRAELATTPAAEHGAVWWLNIFAGAAAGGLLASRWIPQWLDQHVHAPGQGSLLFGACFFVFLNLHHYLIDATIWRSKGELVKAMVRKPSAAAAAAPTGDLVPVAS
jgi:hypothetical protein